MKLFIPKNSYFYFLAFLSVLLGCVPVEVEETTELDTTFVDDTVKMMWENAAHGDFNEIYAFLRHDNPNYRYHAVKTLATQSDASSTDSLISLLHDPLTPIKSLAAYAIGQSGSEKYATDLIQAFDNADSTNQQTRFNSRVLEAVGKCGSENELTLLSTISSYDQRDTLLLLGQLRGLLSLGMKGIMDSVSMHKLAGFFSDDQMPSLVRSYAAYALHRQDSFAIDFLLPDLQSEISDGEYNEFHLQAMKLLTKCASDTCLKFSEKILFEDENANVKILAAQHLAGNDFKTTSEAKLYSLLGKSEMEVQVLVAKHILHTGRFSEAEEYAARARSRNLPHEVRAILYKASLRHLPYYYAVTKAPIIEQVKSSFNSAKKPYEKAAYIRAFSEAPSAYKFVINKGLNSDDAKVRNASAIALCDLYNHNNLRRIFRSKYSTVRSEIVRALNAGIEERDVGLITTIAEKMSVGEFESSVIKQSIYDHRDGLLNAEKYEAYLSVCRLLEFEPEHMPESVLSIDSSGGFLTETVTAEIALDKGVITLELFPLEAPYTVMNFVHLVQSGYYEGKSLHRVVPNFVVQSGCKRGDGYGSMNYVIPTETPDLYYDVPGRVGMASVGRNTESAQWFITHTMCPHLNGRYTIFGQVRDGLTVLQEIEEDDIVNHIKILKG